MRKIIKFRNLAIVAATLFFIFACNKDEEPTPTPTACSPVEPVTPDPIITEQLNYFFQAVSERCYKKYERKRFVINSAEDLWQIYLDYEEPYYPIIAEMIDFEQYTLIGWGMTAIHGGNEIAEVEVCENTLKQVYTIIEIWPKFDNEVTMVTYSFYRWRLYPKFNPNFEINFIEEVRKLW